MTKVQSKFNKEKLNIDTKLPTINQSNVVSILGPEIEVQDSSSQDQFQE